MNTFEFDLLLFQIATFGVCIYVLYVSLKTSATTKAVAKKLVEAMYDTPPRHFIRHCP